MSDKGKDSYTREDEDEEDFDDIPDLESVESSEVSNNGSFANNHSDWTILTCAYLVSQYCDSDEDPDMNPTAIKDLQSANCKIQNHHCNNLCIYTCILYMCTSFTLSLPPSSLVLIAKNWLNPDGGLDGVFKEFEVLMIYTYTPFLYGEHIEPSYWDNQVGVVMVTVIIFENKNLILCIPLCIV